MTQRSGFSSQTVFGPAPSCSPVHPSRDDSLQALVALLAPGERHGGTRRSGDAALLGALAAAGRRGLTQSQLASALGVSAPVMSRRLDLLVDAGIVSREDHPTDRRKRIILLTETGMAQASRDQALQQECSDRILSVLSAQEAVALRGLLSRVINHLRSPGPDGLIPGQA